MTCSVHGLKCSSAYRAKKCRCDDCRAWNSEYMAAWKSRNRVKVLGWQARYRVENADKRRAYAATYNPTWRERNPGYFAEYLQANLDKHRISQNRRRERIRSSTPAGREDEVKTAYAALCAERDRLRSEGQQVEIDHIVPISRGGAHAPENWRLVASVDNRRKHTRLDNELDFEIERKDGHHF